MPVRHPYRRGDVVLVPFLFSGPAGQKTRPAVVLSTNDYHVEWDELLVIGVTSQPPVTVRPTDCFLQDWQAAGLNKPSWVRSHLATFDRRLIVRQLGRLSSRDLSGVEASLRIATGL
jgi:mRNA interferase MazF